MRSTRRRGLRGHHRTGTTKAPGTPPAPGRDRYHHGDLRRALIDAAQHILETEGVSALTLRAAARGAGVSQAAPYRHFTDKDALLAAVAEEGFRALSAAMREATDTAGGDFASRFRALGIAYIRFAVEQPARFRLMFGREIADRGAHLPLHQAANETFGMLVAGIEKGQQSGLIRDGDPRELSMAAWSMVHGLSALLVDGQLSRGTQDLEMFASGVVRYLFLGLRSDPLA